MSESVKYSVIIPVYNRQVTLSRCLDSLLCQHREDVQILVIDDGSQDASGQIARAYAEKYPCIQYHWQENAGVSAARNAGLDRAVGTYVLFVDSDDYVTQNYFAVLDQAVSQGNWDLLVFRMGIAGQDMVVEQGWYTELAQMTTSAQKLKFLLAHRLTMQVPNKCFKNEQIQKMHLRFDERLYSGEDFVFAMRYCVCSSRIESVNRKIYCVDLSDQESLSRKYRPDLADQLHGVFHEIRRTILSGMCYDEIKEELLSIADYLYVKLACSCVAEEFKRTKLSYFNERRRIAQICERFRTPLCDSRCNIIHLCLRIMLKCRAYFLVYLAAYLLKGRKYLRG